MLLLCLSTYSQFYVISCSAEKLRLVQCLRHFFRLRSPDETEDDGDDSKQLDCWELAEPERAATWTVSVAPGGSHLVFAVAYKGEVRDPQVLDLETKVTDFDDDGPTLVKVFISTTRPEPYHFTILIDTIKIPFSIADTLLSLQQSDFSDVTAQVTVEVKNKEYYTANGAALRPKALAKKLRSIMGAIERDVAIQRVKIFQRQLANVSGLTVAASQEQSQASAQVRSAGQTTRRSAVRKSTSASASPAKKRASAKKSDPSAAKKQKLAAKEEADSSYETAILELPGVDNLEAIDYSNANLVFQQFFKECQDAFVFDPPTLKTELDVMRLFEAPEDWTIRAFENKGKQEIKKLMINMPDKSQKQTLCVMPKLDIKPTCLEDIRACDFWIINGQHSVAASKEMMNEDVPEQLRKDFRTWQCFIVWTQDHEKLRRISAFYNRCNHLAPFKPTWATNIISARKVWLKNNRPLPKHAAAGVTDSRVSVNKDRVNDLRFEVSILCIQAFSSTRAKCYFWPSSCSSSSLSVV